MMTRYFRDSGLWTLKLAAVTYLALCLFHGFVWSAEIAPSYGLHIVKVMVAVLLALASVVTLPFQQGALVVHVMVNLLLLAAPVALLGFTCRYTVASLRGCFEPHALRRFETWWPVKLAGSAFFAVAGVAMLAFADAFLHDARGTSIVAFLVDSPVLGIALVSATGLWLLANLAAPLWSRHPRLVRALRSAEAVAEAMSRASGAAEHEEIFHQVILRTGVLMMLAHGGAGEHERRAIRSVFAQVTGRDIDDRALLSEIQAARATGDQALGYLVGLRDLLHQPAKESLVRFGLAIAMADGSLDKSELDLLVSMAEAMELSLVRMDGILNGIEPMRTASAA